MVFMDIDKLLLLADSLRQKISTRGRLIALAIFLFILIFSVGGFVFVTLMERTMLKTAGYNLVNAVEIVRLRLEASVNREIAIALIMADSPLIKRYFANPGDPELKEMALEEFAAYRRAFSANSVFWVNDIDLLFYSNDAEPYKIDLFNPENYWYLMTLYETDVYNFNINYNPDLNVTNLWINAPVFDAEGNRLGIVGTGISLLDFVNTIYQDYSHEARMYFFNGAGEITGARSIDIVVDKIRIEDHLDQIGMEIQIQMDFLGRGDVKYFKTNYKRGVAVLASIPALEWYITAFQFFRITDFLKTGMAVLFTVLMLIMKIVVFSVIAVHKSKLEKARAEAAEEAIISLKQQYTVR